MIRLTQVAPNLPPHIERMAAEILACCDPDPEIRRQHRRDKLATFEGQHQAEVREVVNRVIKARAEANQQRSIVPCSN